MSPLSRGDVPEQAGRSPGLCWRRSASRGCCASTSPARWGWRRRSAIRSCGWDGSATIGIESGIDRRQPQPDWSVAIGLSIGPGVAGTGRNRSQAKHANEVRCNEQRPINSASFPTTTWRTRPAPRERHLRGPVPGHHGVDRIRLHDQRTLAQRSRAEARARSIWNSTEAAKRISRCSRSRKSSE